MPPKKTLQIPETVTVTVQYTSGGQIVKESEDQQVINVRNFVTTPAEVSLEAGMTLNLGNYESGRLTVGVKLPCYMEEIDFAYDYAQHWVEERIAAEAQKMHQYVKDKANF